MTITSTNYDLKDELGHTWIRSVQTEMLLDLFDGDLSEMAAYVDDVNAAVLDASGLQIVMQANGWAVVPEGQEAAHIAAVIDMAHGVVAELYAR